jgi:Carbohydrate family 9 binding domain-like
MKYFFLFILLISTQIVFAQTKQYDASKVTSTIKIDGKIDDAAWASINSINDFITSYPDFGKTPSKKTEVKIIYDNTAMYVLALMYDDKINIRKQEML